MLGASSHFLSASPLTPLPRICPSFVCSLPIGDVRHALAVRGVRWGEGAEGPSFFPPVGGSQLARRKQAVFRGAFH